MPNRIAILQNETPQLELRAAQEQLLSNINHLEFVHFALVLMPIVATVVHAIFRNQINSAQISNSDIQALIGLSTLIVIVVDEIGLRPLKFDWRKQACEIGNGFEVVVLGLKKYLTFDVEPELVSELKEKYLESHSLDSLRDYYGSVPKDIELEKLRFACQRYTCRSNVKARALASTVTLWVTISLLFIIIILAYFNKAQLTEFLLSYAIPITPLIQSLIRTSVEQRRAAAEFQDLKESTELNIFSAAYETSNYEKITEYGEQMQKRIFRCLMTTPSIPVFYSRLIQRKADRAVGIQKLSELVRNIEKEIDEKYPSLRKKPNLAQHNSAEDNDAATPESVEQD